MAGMGSNGSGSMDMDSDAGDSTTTIDVPEGAEFNAADVAFAQRMIPHHAQAVVMAEMALDTSTNDDVLELAEQIRAAQSPEIEQMTTWLTDWDQSVPDAEADMGGSGGMSGMMSETDMDGLRAATGSGFDRMFLEMMVIHHEGAIEMAEEELAEGLYQPTKDLAQAVITGQQAEIETMNGLLSDLPS